MTTGKKVSIIGSGNWGTTIARIVGQNVQKLDIFQKQVPMYVYEEILDGQKLSEIINTKHENIKYLPGFTLPDNVVAITDVAEAAKDADVLVFVVPHQFVKGICKALAGKMKKGAIAISLIKGLDATQKGVDLVTNMIRTALNIPCAVLMGANVAQEVAQEDFCEATIGCRDQEIGQQLKLLMQTPYFRITVIEDEEAVELCGALKNVVACGAGFIDGLGFGGNTKAAVVRLGLMEMIAFVKQFNQNSRVETFIESCGIADLITTCYGGRNRKVAEAMVKTGKTIEVLETEMLNGQKVQGPPAAAEVYAFLKEKQLESKFPLFVAIHKICIGELKPQTFIDCLKNHPENM